MKMPTPHQIRRMAEEYCRIRLDQDGATRTVEEQIRTAEVMTAWLVAWDISMNETEKPNATQ